MHGCEIVVVFLSGSLEPSKGDRHSCNERNSSKMIVTSVGQERSVELREHTIGELDIITEIQEVTGVLKSKD